MQYTVEQGSNFLKSKKKKGQYFFRKENFCLEVTKNVLKHWHIGDNS